ncbi:MAG: TonB-dependent receptor [Lentimicrobium sp.]|jgi:outer membrane receptor for ferrienterochelin and colicins|nr:TonB-dependent receptor [Lentimicrobium sp.]
MNKGLFIIACFLCLPVLIFGQESTVRVVDARDGKPIAFAHVKVSESGSTQAKFFVTDFDGNIELQVKKCMIVQVTYVGYQQFVDTLLPDKSTEIRLLPEVFSLDEVVVTAQYNPLSADRSLYKVNVINQLQLRRSASADLAGVLRNQMNIRFSQDASLGTGMSLQGLAGEHVKILVDGVPVIGRLNGSIDLNQVNIQNARQVEIIEGPMSVIYGSNALAGVVNIISQDIPSSAFSAHASNYMESVGIINFDGGVSIRKGKNAFGIQAGRNFFGGYSPVDEGRSKLWKPRRQVNADVNHSFSLTKYIVNSRLSYFDELLLVQGDLREPYYEKAFDNHFNTQRMTAKVDLSTKSANPFTMSNSLSFYRRMRTLYYNDLTLLKKTPTEFDTTGFGSFLSRGMYAYKTLSGIFGTQIGYDVNTEWGTGDRIGGAKQEISDIAGFATMQYQPIEWLSVQPGFRYAYNTKFNSPLIYALHSKVGPYKGMLARVSYSNGFRAPSLKELYLYFVDVNHDITGNPDLKPEHSNHLQLQLSHRIEKVKYATETEVRFFLNDIEDQITIAQADSTSYTYFNLDHSRTMGYAVSLRSSLYPIFDFRLGWGYTGIANQLEGTDSMKLFWSPEMTTEATCRFDKIDLSFTASYKYTGRTTRLILDADENISESFMDSYHNLDVSVMKSFLNKRFTANAGVRNLFDVTNITSTGASAGVHSSGGGNAPVAWGRTFFIKLTFNISKNEQKNNNR